MEIDLAANALPAHAPVTGTVQDRLVAGLRALADGQQPHEPIAMLVWLAGDVRDRLRHSEAQRDELSARIAELRRCISQARRALDGVGRDG